MTNSPEPLTPAVVAGSILPELLTPAQVSEALNVAPSTVRAWGRSGALRSTVLPGGQRRYFRDEVQAIARGEASA